MGLALDGVAADVDDGCGVGGPGGGAEFLAVVFGVVGDLAGDVAFAVGRGFGDPEVVVAVAVGLPGKAAFGGSGGEVGGEGRAEGLLDGEGLLGGGWGRGERASCCDEQRGEV